ncbi:MULTISPECIES: phosphatidate cytidylyltransferase [Leptospira]|uniref:Phosphatidate cytidylyltransferase n=1 Tax=Leptospira kirschneri str. 200802841 TaxID=1193047 RepID=A0A828Y9B0_9LEPT|nr:MULTISPECIES: CDP-archaeol synthase [Leptospira]EMO77168.1 phosphatidate cytidylyltransferase [Leptospira kirschneri str. 200801925]EJO69941.1 phosphatidate cytidylyltransferase [Leptospira kirschneri serovar Grippotyphosa str. RM52]EKO52441.1 phosphatidate cytidylyltransferase [Leptospira kirschneri str. 200802841]EKP05799.1 phosphatidate cytidylyltransferase [Leptospira kirschneri str. 2008720114]EKQ83725.1 phosphatidate cytidylyltransferase [Leptospira kirschneri serovar Grippotyphosa st
MGETSKRLASAAVLILFYLFMIFYPGFYYLQTYLILLLGGAIGIKEFYNLSDRGEDGRPFRGTGVFFMLLVISFYYFRFLGSQNQFEAPLFFLQNIKYFIPPFDPVPVAFLLLFIVTFTLQITRRPLDGAIFSVSSTFLGVFYVAVPLGHFLLLLGMAQGIYYIVFVSVVTFLTDAGAYFGGRWFGRHPAGLAISPKKTWEGYVTGIFTAIGSVFIFNIIWEYSTGTLAAVRGLEVFLISAILSFVSVIGDLLESAMKRDAKIKDSGSLIPGHGGILDLADALLITIPVLYYYLQIKGNLGV